MTEEISEQISKSADTKRATRNQGPTPKGERTRRQILDGAIFVVAEQGVAAATHRAVAKAAGVSLSTTTYYFTSLDDLLTQAFVRLSERTDQNNAGTVLEYETAIANSGVTLDSPLQERIALRDELLLILLDYFDRTADDWRVLMRAEVRFLFEATRIADLKTRVTARRNMTSDSLSSLSAAVGAKHARIEGEMMHDLLLLAEFNALTWPSETLKPATRDRFTRFFDWILNI